MVIIIITVINIILFHHVDARWSRFVMMTVLLPLQNPNSCSQSLDWWHPGTNHLDSRCSQQCDKKWLLWNVMPCIKPPFSFFHQHNHPHLYNTLIFFFVATTTGMLNTAHGGTMLLCTVNNVLQSHKVSHLKWLESSSTLLWAPQILFS